jgi:hypothetical protein
LKSILQVSAYIVKGEESFYTLDPRTFKTLTIRPLAPHLGPDGDGELAGGEVGRGKANKRWGTAIGLTCDRLLVAVDRPGRSSASGGGATTGARTAVRKGALPNNVLHRELPCGLGKTLGRCLGSEDQRRGELVGGGPAAAAGARAPAIVWLGLINKRLGELL